MDFPKVWKEADRVDVFIAVITFSHHSSPRLANITSRPSKEAVTRSTSSAPESRGCLDHALHTYIRFDLIRFSWRPGVSFDTTDVSLVKKILFVFYAIVICALVGLCGLLIRWWFTLAQ